MALRQNSGTASKSSQRFRKLAVGAQIALSVLLFAAAPGLFVRTLDNLSKQNVGYSLSPPCRTFSLDPTNRSYGERSHRLASVDSTLRLSAAFLAVVSTAATTDPELSGDSTGGTVSVQGYKPGEDENMTMERPQITAGYFATLRQPILAGREFTASDGKGQPSVAVVNLLRSPSVTGSAADMRSAYPHQKAEGTTSNTTSQS